MLGVSVDSSPANRAFAQQNSLTFPLLSDFKRNISKEYGVLNEQYDFANRTTFVIDKEGVIQHIDRDKEAIDPSGAGDECSLLEHQKK